ncbi:WAT1-related protein At5g47470 [Oryza brachyantha]|uniref:WAT1-related protein n=1 Tax=Oryza brachyantha TaxID=4533 RepID=J3MAJ8_ORYBR|nr:WAT1-related protein At5g47470 [Oryza brachyantha]
MEAAVMVGGLLVAQCILAGYVVFVHHVLALGANPLAIILIAAVASSLFFLPFALALERKKWPSKISRTLLAQLLLIALGGTTLFQELMLLGIKKTTPAIASAMPNLSPGLIFVVAACFRLEKFDKACKYTRAKILGTLVCLVGAMAMSFLQSPISSSSPQLTAISEPEPAAADGTYYDWILGCSYLLLAVVVLSLYTVLQAATLASFPAPLTMCSVTSMMGAVFTAILQLTVEGKIDVGSPRIDLAIISVIVLMGGGVVGGCVVFQTWCIGKRGPLLVSIFGPVQTVCSALLFGQIVSFGSLAGMALMFCGLYVVLWAKSNEEGRLDGGDVEKPLLS